MKMKFGNMLYYARLTRCLPARFAAYLALRGFTCCNIRQHGQSSRALTPGGDKFVSAYSVTKLRQRLPRPVLAKFHVYR
jgi:hypothetical protein